MSTKTTLIRASSPGLGRRQTAQTEPRGWDRTFAIHGILPLLLLSLMALSPACTHPRTLILVNSTDQIITALFAPNGGDLLAGAQLPPSTFVEVQTRRFDTGKPTVLEAYTTTGACASHVAEGGRWELRAEDLDPSGC